VKRQEVGVDKEIVAYRDSIRQGHEPMDGNS
jgi:hypothetical protein